MNIWQILIDHSGIGAFAVVILFIFFERVLPSLLNKENELNKINNHIQGMEKNMGIKFDGLEKNIDNRFEAVEGNVKLILDKLIAGAGK